MKTSISTNGLLLDKHLDSILSRFDICSDIRFSIDSATKNQNLLIEKLNSLGPDESTKKPTNVEHTTFVRPNKIKKFLFIKTQDYKWLNAKIEITKESNEYKIIKNKIINFIFN